MTNKDGNIHKKRCTKKSWVYEVFKIADAQLNRRDLKG